jgi:hypothetical protein
MEDDGSRLAPSLAAIRPDAPDEIPVLDLTGYFNGLADFYFIVGHGISPTLIDATFAAGGSSLP